ncbi:DUF5522 domain-containing protein [Rhodoflexus sp.]
MKNPLSNNNDHPAAENRYYYIENRVLIFTALYHRKRGYCCKRGCRHCPYGNSPQDNAGKK